MTAESANGFNNCPQTYLHILQVINGQAKLFEFGLLNTAWLHHHHQATGCNPIANITHHTLGDERLAIVGKTPT